MGWDDAFGIGFGITFGVAVAIWLAEAMLGVDMLLLFRCRKEDDQ